MGCYCGSSAEYQKCCGRFIEGKAFPETPEALMRSRFTAYCTGAYQYILDTYSEPNRRELSVKELENSGAQTQWLSLNVIQADTEAATVEFVATGSVNKQLFVLQETSSFILENGNEWKYDSGILHQNFVQVKPGRNDACPCLSGKKYKQCCLRKMQ